MEVFEYDDKKLSFLWLIFFFQLTLLMMIVLLNIHKSVCVCVCICKNPGQERKGVKYLIHVYLGRFPGMSWQWFCKFGHDQ